MYYPILYCKSLIFSLGLIFFSVINSIAQSTGPDAHYRLLAGKSYVQSKNYYLLTLFEELPDVKKLLSADSVLAKFARNKVENLTNSLTTCEKDALCFTDKIKFSESEIMQISERLSDLYQPGNPLGKLVTNHLIPSGTYILFQNNSPKDMLVKAWEQDARGINFAIGVYAEGKKPNYPNIDSISFNTRDPKNPTVYLNGYVGLLYNTTSLISLEAKNNPLFFTVPITGALQFIEMNEREQAGDFEPMAAGENKAAFDRIKLINWDKYKYTVIEIPGAGPDDPKVALSAEGMLRCRLAAIQYHNGTAPFIVVSGGKVHPYKTKFCEAIEMKKFLISKLHIPESAIIIDPHARHTTTNMRNTVRIMYRYGMPISKPGITCTTRGQSTMIGTTLINRCLNELHESPYKNGKRLTETEIEFYPVLDALHINPLEPIDP